MTSIDTSIPADTDVVNPRTPATTRKSLLLSESIVSGLVRVADALAIALTGLLFYSYLFSWSSEAYRAYLTEIAVNIGLTLSVFHYAGLYDFNTIVAWPSRMRQMVLLSALVMLVLAALAVALQIADQFSRLWFFASFVGSSLLMFTSRGIAKSMIRRLARSGTLIRNMAIVGASGQAQHLVERLHQHDAPWKRIIGVFDDRRTRISNDIDGLPVLGNLDDLVTYVRRGLIQDVVITLPWSADARLINIIGKLRALPVHVYLGSDLIGYHFPRHREQFLEGVPVMEIASAPLTGWSGLLKSIEDKVIASIILLLLSPLMLGIALAVRLDSPGPVLFRQKRYGFNNEVIVVYKYRSMYHNRPKEAGVIQARKGDPRVTRIGGILRRTSLDELPQLLNVLKGDMSLIGPRPHAVEHNEQYAKLIGGYHGRHKVKPGITGWAQVCGFRGETDTLDKMRMRVEHDIFYIENWSIWFDVKVLFLTAFIGWTHKNAY
ncbi:undecaprenyl-phosphate glucose phosphotransferase [Defluviicoccus vanus]|uniref:undecaprenyl-phosphate glucose phosphotransferase n=1 Tax=Defluviicoccus vanus TaxID=111831 RepID=UPI001CBA6718|nr:undecaprenyl-phosphate glucose phosphotransferase [Defluviicoccus vanus]